MTLNFGTIAVGDSPAKLQFTLHNLADETGFTARLDLDDLLSRGDTDLFVINETFLAALQAGSYYTLEVVLNPQRVGTFAARFEFLLSDEDLLGAQRSNPLSLEVRGVVIPEPSVAAVTLLFLSFTGLAARRRKLTKNQ